MTRNRAFSFVIEAFISAVLTACPSFAQISNTDAPNMTPTAGAGHDYIHMLTETVSPVDGSLSVRIGVPVPPSRGFTVPFSFAYDSNLAHGEPGAGGRWGGNGGVNTLYAYGIGGWSYMLPHLDVAYLSQSANNPDNPGVLICTAETGYVFHDESGQEALLALAYVTDSPGGASSCKYTQSLNDGGNSNDFYTGSLQGSLPSAIITSQATGMQYTADGLAGGTASKIEDRNGNTASISVSGSASGAGFSETDTSGRIAVQGSGFGVTGSTVTASGMANPYTLTWGTATSNFTPNSTTPSPPSECGPVGTYQDTQSVVSAIELPNAADQFKFTYESVFGQIHRITYPNGGYVQYDWGYDPQSELAVYASTDPDFTADPSGPTCYYVYDRPAVTHRYVSYDGVNIAEQQDFSYATTGWNWTSPSNSIYPTWGTKTTTVTTHDLLLGTTNVTTYTYNGNQRSPSPPNIYPSSSNQVPTEQQIQYQDGSGHTLLTVNKTWADRDSLKSEQHIIPTGASSSISSQTVYQRGPGLVITEQDDYDFGAASPTRKTINTYQTFASGHAGELPCKSVVYDSQSNIASETDTLYDGGTVVCGAAGTPSVTAVSGLPTGGHDESNYSATSTTARGNATSVTKRTLAGRRPQPSTATTKPARWSR